MPLNKRGQEHIDFNAAKNKASEMIEQGKDTKGLLAKALQWIADGAGNLFGDSQDGYSKTEVTRELRDIIDSVKEDNQ